VIDDDTFDWHSSSSSSSDSLWSPEQDEIIDDWFRMMPEGLAGEGKAIGGKVAEIEVR